MTAASGMFLQVAYKAETAFGTIPAASSAQLLRRVTSTLGLKKDTFTSKEIRPDFQLADMRHGVRRIGGAINGELSPGTYKDFFAAALKKDFVAGVAATGLSITITVAGLQATLTRSTGSYITDGFKAGDVVRLTAGAFNAANLNKNIRLINVTATTLVGFALNGSALVAEGPIASATVSVTGKKTFTPASAQTDKSFSIEHWYSDLALSEVFDGCKVSKISVGLPPTDIASCTVEFMGQDVVPAASQYFTSPTAVTTSGALAGVNGSVRVNGTDVANVTGLSIDISCGQDGLPAVGSQNIAFYAAQRVIVTGNLTMTFDSATYRDLFFNETEFSVVGIFTTSSDPAADFIAFSLRRVKVTAADRTDGEKTLTVSLPFQALLYNGGSTISDATTIVVQDSQA